MSLLSGCLLCHLIGMVVLLQQFSIGHTLMVRLLRPLSGILWAGLTLMMKLLTRLGARNKR